MLIEMFPSSFFFVTPETIFGYEKYLNVRTVCEICSNLVIKTPERRNRRCCGVFIVNFEHILHIFLSLVFSLLNLIESMPAVVLK